MRKYLFSALAILFLCTCGGSRKASPILEQGDTIPLQHAQLLTMVERDSELEIIVRNPQDSTLTLQHLTLQVPIRKAALSESFLCGLLEELGCIDKVGGICDTPFCHIPSIEKGLRENTIRDLGNGMNPNIEQIADLQPGLFLTTPYEGNSGFSRIEQLGIPLVFCADYMENTPLARAEWMKLFGRLFGKGEEADSLFAQIEQKYLALKKLAESTSSHPKLLCETPYQGAWYIPRGESCTAILYQDAGAEYLFSDISGTGNAEQSIEYVMNKALLADVWITKHHGPLSRKQLEEDTPILTHIKAPLWVCDTSQKLFFEQTTFHPELLLEEIVHILHPEIGIGAKNSYFCPQE